VVPLSVFEELWNRTVAVLGVTEADPSKRVIRVVRD
jgi:hypothetical protein